MVWHLFRKDARLLWPFALAVVLGQGLNAALHFVRDHFASTLSFSYVTILFPIIVLLGIAFLGVALVHQEPLPGTAHDWQVRPVRRRDLVLAKILFMLLLVHVPILLVDFAEGILSGIDAGAALFAACTRGATLFASITVPALMLGALTASLAEAVLLGGVTVAGFAALVVVLSAGNSWPHSPMGLGWIPTAATHVGILLMGVAVIAFQYSRRQTHLARTIALIAFLALIPVSHLPFGPSFAVQQLLSGASARQVSMDIAPATGDSRTRDIAGGTAATNSGSTFGGPLQRSATLLELPVRIANLPGDGILFADHVMVRLVGNDGKVRYQGVGNCARNPYSTGTLCAPSELAASAAVQTYAMPLQRVMIPTPIYERLKSEPLRAEVDYFLTLFAGRPQISLGTHERLHSVAGLGLCRTRIDDDGDEVMLTCVSANTPPSCMTIALADPETRRSNPPMHQCGFDYAPYVRSAYEDPLVRFRIDLPFTDSSRTIRFPIDARRIEDARLLIKTYAPVAHFRRRLVIPVARLSDWEAPQMQAGNPTAGGPYRLMN